MVAAASNDVAGATRKLNPMRLHSRATRGRTCAGALTLTTIIAITLIALTAGSASAQPPETIFQAFNCPAQSPAYSTSPVTMQTSGRWNFRVAPYTGSCTLIRTLQSGTTVQVIGANGNWRYVRIKVTGEEGWIYSTGLRSATRLGAPGSPTGWTTTASHGGCSIRVDSSIARHVTELLRAAHNDGFTGLCGWGWRSSAQQIDLRRRHCGTSYYAIYQMPSWMCSPPTAIPGTSNHERGLAIDFYTGPRSSITSAEFSWLQRNAATFGLYNLPSERWHWSTNGR